MAKNKTDCIYCGWLMLIAGILYAAKDLGYWNFFGLEGWAILFVLWGACKVWGHK